MPKLSRTFLDSVSPGFVGVIRQCDIAHAAGSNKYRLSCVKQRSAQEKTISQFLFLNSGFTLYFPHARAGWQERVAWCAFV